MTKYTLALLAALNELDMVNHDCAYDPALAHECSRDTINRALALAVPDELAREF